MFRENPNLESLESKTTSKTTSIPVITITTRPNIEILKSYLDWAGIKLLSLPTSRPGPKSYSSHWPEFKQEFASFNISVNLKFKPAIPSGEDIDNLDLIFSLINIIDDINTRRILQARSLINPISRQHLYSWTKLGVKLQLSAMTCKRYYYRGLDEIKHKTPLETLVKIRVRMNGVMI